MRKILTATLLAASFLAPVAANAATYTINKVVITGNKLISLDKLTAAIKVHHGAKVSPDDLKADDAAIAALYDAANIGLRRKVTLLPSTEGRYNAVFALEEVPPPPPTVTMVHPKLHEMQFVGNKAVPTAALMQAANMKPGDELTNEKIAEVQKAIKSVYDTKKVNGAIAGENRKNADGTYDVIWTITEGGAKGG